MYSKLTYIECLQPQQMSCRLLLPVPAHFWTHLSNHPGMGLDPQLEQPRLGKCCAVVSMSMFIRKQLASHLQGCTQAHKERIGPKLLAPSSGWHQSTSSLSQSRQLAMVRSMFPLLRHDFPVCAPG